MNLAEARALCPVHIAPFDPPRSRKTLELLAQWALRFSPVVSVDPTPWGYYTDPCPDGLLLNVTGEAPLFGGEPILLTEIRTQLQRLGFASRLAVAPTVGAAWAIAHFGPHSTSILSHEHLQNALAPLPVASLRITPELCTAMRDVGIEYVRHLLAIPRPNLLVRYGKELLLRLDQAFGRTPELVTPIHPTAPLQASRVFEGPAIQIEAILLTVQTLLEDLTHHLLQQESGVRGLRLELLRAHAPPVFQEWILARPSRDKKHLWELLRTKVERLHLGYGVEAVKMTAYWTEAIPHQQRDAWETANDHDESFAALLDTLIGRWGSNRVLSPRTVASHTPEVARQFRPLTEKSAPPADLALLDRPSVLFDPPEPAEAFALQPDRPPVYLRWKGQGHELLTGQGPERIVTEWWGAHRSSTRDYYKVQILDGSWIWTFQEVETGRWFIHGLWA